MKIDNFDNKKAYANGYSDEEFDLRWKICEIPMDILDNVNGIGDKIDSDNETEISFVNNGTHKPTTRGERRKATAKAKKRLREIYNNTFYNDSIRPVVRNGNEVAYIREGSTFSWHPEWKKMDRRLRRHEGKNLCFNYVAEDATETEDIWMIPDEGWLEDYPEEAERLEERIEWMQYLEEEESDKKQNLYEYYLDPGPEIWNEEEGRYYEGKPIPSGQAALEWIREHNLIDELERWVKEKIGEI